VPIYGYYDTYLGHGIVGGSFVTFEEIGRKAAQASLRILSGESPQDVAHSEIGQSIPMFDWRELRRWNISERRVPPGGVMLFREATYWEKNRWLILGVVAASLIEGLLIAVLFVQLRRRRQVEAFLRESEQQMGLAASAAELAMWTWDIVRNQIWMSDKGRALFGIAPDARLDSAALSAHVHPDDRAARDAVIRRALETQGEYAMEYRVVLDGQVHWIAGRGRVEFAGGKPVLMRGISLDITERRQAELEVARQRNELAHRSRVMLLGELSGSLAHELNQPLGAIVTNAGAALRCLARDSMTSAMFREVLEDIVASGRRGGEIIRGIKGMLRKAEGARQLVDLNDVIAQTLRLTQSDALANNCAVLTEFYPALPKVEADVVQLQQVFLNLILNAFEASKDVPKLQRRVIIHTERNGDGTVRACVRDFGAGLPAEASEQVFEQFFSTKRDGMGMGLFISRSIVAAHRGTLCAENATDGGAQFWLRLPASKEINV
jgi:PAS domain S-box-containing protein